MSAITIPARFNQRGSGGLGQALHDGLILAWRYLKRVPRIPELAIFAIIGSIIFVLLFAFVFGGAIPLPGFENVPTAYREFLMPGIFAQNIAFAAGTTAIGIADDMSKGIIDRFRSLPMARSAVLTGRSFSDVVYNLGILFVLMATGFLVGWTWRTGLVELFAGIGLLLLFAFAMSWVGIYLGLSVPSPEVANQVDLHLPVSGGFHLQCVRTALHAARFPAASRRVEPGFDADGRHCANCGATRTRSPRAPAWPHRSRSW